MPIAQALLYRVGLSLYRLRARQRHAEPPTVRDSWRWQWDTSSKLLAKYPGLHLRSTDRVLDVGCGVGGRSCYLASHYGVAALAAIDINRAEIEQAQQLQRELAAETLDRLQFTAVEPHAWGHAPGSFDAILLIDVMEHALEPRQLLHECHSLLRPGGKVFFGSNGWYHYNAAHMIDLLPVPFVTALFSDTTILNVVRRIVSSPYYIPTQWDSAPPVARYEGIEDLRDRPGEALNKYSIAAFERLVYSLPFDEVDFRVLGPHRAPLRYLNGLTRIPGLREIWHNYIVATLTK